MLIDFTVAELDYVKEIPLEDKLSEGSFSKTIGLESIQFSNLSSSAVVRSRKRPRVQKHMTSQSPSKS